LTLTGVLLLCKLILECYFNLANATMPPTFIRMFYVIDEKGNHDF
jgi:hypothetical protein